MIPLSTVILLYMRTVAACCRNDSILKVQTHSLWQIAPGISLLHKVSIQLLIYRHATYFIKWVYKLRSIKKNNICIHSHSLHSSSNVNGLRVVRDPQDSEGVLMTKLHSQTLWASTDCLLQACMAAVFRNEWTKSVFLLLMENTHIT